MPAAIERIVVQTTPQEKKAIVAKAKKLGVPISELMRRGAVAYDPLEENEALGALADAAHAAIERMIARLDATHASIEASNKRIAEMEEAARKARDEHR